MKMKWLKILVFIACLLPLALLLIDLVGNNLGVNPIETLTRNTGLWALRLLLITLTVSPICLLCHFPKLAGLRRMLGLYSFFYASIHFLLYVWLDQFFVVNDIINDVIKRPFIAVGFSAYIGLVLLAITSNKWSVVKLGTFAWKRLHKVVYLIAIACVIHFYMLVKFDTREPLIYASILTLLLGFRLLRYLRWKVGGQT